MRGLLKATVAVLLAPAVELVRAAVPELVSTDNGATSRSLITLDLGPDLGDRTLQQTTLDLRVFESTTPCGYANVTLNGESLEQDEFGVGSGFILTDSGAELAADWKVACVHLEQGSPVQSLSVHVFSPNGEAIDEAAFWVQFHQTAPVSMVYIDGVRASPASLLAPDSLDNPRPSLVEELAELEVLKKQLIALEHSIALKITHISDAFNLDRPEELLAATNCEGLKCFFSSLYDQVKAVAGKLYHGTQEAQENQPSRSGNLQGPSNGGQHPLGEIDGTEHPESTPSPKETGRISSQVEAENPKSMSEKGAGHSHILNTTSVLNGPHQIWHIIVLVVVVLVIVINLAVMILICQCVRLLRQRRQARQEKRRSRLRKSREDCNALVATKSMDLVRWLRDTLGREDIEEQEKEAMRREQIVEPESDGESSDTLSITMEEEIAQFRAAARAVEHLVSVEEGRGRGRLSEHLSSNRQRRASTPSSIMSSCPTYRSVDESLPAYDENRSPDYVADGFQYSPGSSTPGYSSARSSTSEESTTCSSLDENIGPKD
ncbi:hypothetical protein F5Y14DRAFT_267571 [Nemania sp. NC0429]|nr:hypothetical protein F5Y14DRAFT_267571 [Nemania sp. NC0429]